MKNGFRVIDGDGHMQEPMDIWATYTEPAYRERIPKVSGHLGRAIYSYDPCEAFPEGHSVIYEDSVFADMEARYGDAYRSWWSLDTRLAHLDQDGVDNQVCFPTNGSVATSAHITDFSLQAALCRAYNRWSEDFCRPSEGRVQYIAQITLKDIGLAVEEINRVAPTPEVAGIMLMGSGTTVPASTGLTTTSLLSGKRSLSTTSPPHSTVAEPNSACSAIIPDSFTP